MKILLTGADGQLGCCIKDVFADSAYEVIALNRAALDISDAEAVNSIVEAQDIDFIINAAAYTAVDKAEMDSELAYRINSLAPANLATAAKSVGATLIHISTDYVFDGCATEPYQESDATSPQGTYGASKLKGEQAVQDNCKDFVILRTAWVFSEYGNNFLKTMLRLAGDRDELSVVADQIGCPTYAGDIARACLAIVDAIAKGNFSYGIYHFAGDESVSWHGFASAIFAAAKELGLRTPSKLNAIGTADYPTPAKRPAYSVLNTRKIEDDYSVIASDWRASLTRVITLVSQSK